MILILDDDPGMIEAIGEYLMSSPRKEFHNFVKISLPEVAIHLIKRNEFDLIITDIVMPRLNGVELIRKIKKRYGDKIKLLCLSGYSDIFVSELEEFGVDFLEKPFAKVDLLNKVEQLLPGSD